MKNKILWITLLALCLFVPASALAVTEGVVEAAPHVEMEAIIPTEISYLPDGSYYAGYGDWKPAWEEAQQWIESEFDGECYNDVEQRPRMTAGEAARAEKLLAAYNADKTIYKGESILNKMENVIVGVYALNPADFDGEKAYVILPGPCMTDEQILAVIDAYDQLGLTFDPAKLSARNCARGGGIETNRFLNEEERARHQNLARLIEHGLLDISGVDAAKARNVRLDSRYFCNLPDFTIRPYRAVADEEFVALLVDLGYHDKTGEVDYGSIEKESRAILNGRLGAALSMELSQIYHEGSYVPRVYDQSCNAGYNWSAQSRRCFGANYTYHTAEGILIYADVMFDWETKELVGASVMYSKEGGGEPLAHDEQKLTDEQIASVIAEAEELLGISKIEWHFLDHEEIWTNWGPCNIVRAQIGEGEWITVYIGCDDGKMRGLEISGGTLVDSLPEDDVPVNG